MFIPIGILVDFAEKSAKMSRNNAPIEAIIWYYLNFVVHFANILFPIFLFLSVIWFTSKLAERTEIVRSEEHTSELQSPDNLVCRLLLEKKKRILQAI